MKKKILSLLLAAAMLATCTAAFTSCKKDEPDTGESTSAVTDDQNTEIQPLSADRNPLTGLGDYEQGYEGKKFIGIVVENSPDARPQWGLSTPDILMEYEVEGGISRMLWLYANENRIPAKVGPVRSARHDIVELALGYDMLFIHCGGSYIALDLIEAHPELAEIEGMQSFGFFERDTTRNVSSEHRLCLMGDTFRNDLGNLGRNMTVETAKARPFNFTDVNAPRTLSGGICTTLKFSYSGNYNYEFSYNEETSLYECSLNDKARTDDQGIRCAYSNVIVLYTEMIDLGDSSGHQDLLLENGGKGIYINGGNYEEITWSKPAAADMLKMYDADGNELQLNCGNSYIGFVRSTQAAKTSIN